MRFQFIVIAVALFAAAACAPALSRSLAPASQRGTFAGPIAPSAKLSLYISLKGQHANEIDRLIDAQNTPGSPLYRHYLTPVEYGRYFGAADREYAAAIALLRARGFVIDDLPANHADIEAHASARTIEEFFQTPIDLRVERGRVFYTNRYDPVFPPALHLLSVAGLENYVRWRPHFRTGTASPSSTVGKLTGWGPPDIQSAYDLGPVYAQYTGQGETVIDATYGTVRNADFKAFNQQFGLHAKLSQIGLDGAPVDNQGESTLDVEWMAAIAPSAKILLVSSANDTVGFLKMHRYIVNQLSQDHVVSTSWGWCEQYYYNSFGYYVGGDQRLFAQASSEGQWWLAAAGDQGADDCEIRHNGPVAVDYPGSSRYVLDVGGTSLTPATISNGSYSGWGNEVVWNDSCGASAGGKSVLFVKPSYQLTAAPHGYMREVPDVTLMADGCDIGGYIIYLKGGFQNQWYGTSFAAPEWAAFLALVQQRYGSTPIASPSYRLYALAATPAYTSLFHDIVSGCNHYHGVPGFCAAPGYDDASGLGSFQGAALQAAY